MKLLNYFKQKTKNEYKHLNLIYSNLFKSKSRLIILLYHRIVPEISINPVGTYINCIDFEKQIKYLSNKYEIIDLSQLSENLNKYKNSNKTYLAITLDDGFCDNYLYAFPILKSLNIKASFFLPTKYIDTKNVIWDWKIIKLILLNKKFEINLNKKTYKRMDFKNREIEYIWKIINYLKTFEPIFF